MTEPAESSNPESAEATYQNTMPNVQSELDTSTQAAVLTDGLVGRCHFIYALNHSG